MKRFSEQLQKKANQINLQADEKRLLKDRLFSYMEYHPLSKKTKESIYSSEVMFDPVLKVFNINKWQVFRFSSLTLAVLLLVVPYIAEKSVPGDMLYAVKVNLNEELRSTLARSSYEKVAWETERLNRRIAEAYLLVNEGKMTNEIEMDVAKAVKTHNENARKEIENLKLLNEDEAIMATAELDTTIDIQSSVIRNNMASTSVGNLTIHIAEVLNESQTSRLTYSEAFPSWNSLVAKLERETTRAYELLNSVNNIANQEEKTNIKRRLEDIERKSTEAFSVFEQSEMEASKSIFDILKDVQKLIVYMTNIDVRASLSLEEMVPIVLTREERLVMIKSEIESTVNLLESTELALTASSTPEIKEKATKALENSRKQLLEEVIPILEEESTDLESVGVRVEGIKTVIKDTYQILGVRDEVLIELRKNRASTTTTNNGTTTPATTTEKNILDTDDRLEESGI